MAKPILTRRDIERLVFGSAADEDGLSQRPAPRRFTQDSPILPDVWIRYVEVGLDKPLDLLLEPHRRSNAGLLADVLRKRLESERASARWKKLRRATANPRPPVYIETHVLAELYFDELIRLALPLTNWWKEYVRPLWDKLRLLPEAERLQQGRDYLEQGIGQNSRSADLSWIVHIVGHLAWLQKQPPWRSGKKPQLPDADQLLIETYGLLNGAADAAAREWEGDPPLWLVTVNRPASSAVWRSVPAIKADAAGNLFKLDCGKLRWAVIDSGIDATHIAFRNRDGAGKASQAPFALAGDRAVNNTRILATLDFTRMRDLLAGAGPAHEAAMARLGDDDCGKLCDLQRGLRSGRSIDWSLVEPALRIEHRPGQDKTGNDHYIGPQHEHGTHVAGILAGDWRQGDDPSPDDHDLTGVCPGLPLYDLRVLDQNGVGDEFAILAALQYVRYLNGTRDEPVVHGINISISILHDVANYACGRTPVCEECERLIGAGVVVVAAAGNEGFAKFNTPQGERDGYRSISITDPGNAEGVITVGATHRFKPHTYGVSYFSSRGPTGDGRAKPDLVAPGEKITAPIPDRRAASLDGTSMAAPHASGAAALLMARHAELIGEPRRIKEILCKTATDLGREHYFQGAGMLDVLRALQAV
jgi:hypothetical protein